MGADGHVVLIPVAEFDARFPDVSAARFSLYERTVLGTPAYVYYWDTEDHDPPWDWGPPSIRNEDGTYGWGEPWTDREREVVAVLRADGMGEEITVWT